MVLCEPLLPPPSCVQYPAEWQVIGEHRPLYIDADVCKDRSHPLISWILVILILMALKFSWYAAVSKDIAFYHSAGKTSAASIWRTLDKKTSVNYFNAGGVVYLQLGSMGENDL